MKTPVAIVGGGPGGCALSLFLAQQGIRSTIIEAEQFPRYHIGESMTGECGGVVRALGLEQKMADRAYPRKWGVHVYGHNPWFIPVMYRTPERELRETFTWQVRRSEFDKMMLDEALGAGANLVRGQATTPLVAEDGSARGVRVAMADGGVQDVLSEVLVDASGHGRWLGNSRLTSRMELGHYAKQVAIFTQVRGAIRDEGKQRDDTLIFYKQLVHWAWFIPLDDETVSVGVVSPGSYFRSRKESKHDFLRRELQDLHPELKRRLTDLDFLEEARAVENYSYQIRDFTGKGWLCLGDAHRFVDPIFSFGLFVTMKEAQLAAPAIAAYLGGANRDAADPFAAHREQAEFGLDKLQDLVDAFWSQPLAFALLVHQREPESAIDLFAGRIYGREPDPAWEGMRKIKQHAGRWWEQTENWWDSQAVSQP